MPRPVVSVLGELECWVTFSPRAQRWLHVVSWCSPSLGVGQTPAPVQNFTQIHFVVLEEMHAEQTDRQTYRQTNRQTDRQTSKVNIPKYTMRETIKSYLQTVLQPDLKLFKWTLQLRLQQLPQHFQWFCYIHHNSNDIRWFAVTFHLAATTAVIYYHTLLLSYAGAATFQHWSTSYCVHCTLSPWTRRSCILIRCSVTVYGYKFIITLCVCTLQR